ncbi:MULTISPECIES: BON domain-containing protein [unclassified Massilia]|uniref:BON domain-containing protein n=1 Tax=unclassified Massilia TaxID=2609279 RepID=UPI00177A8038|nr:MULTISPECIES: BON domain-containing protein [unclassified Massilia]MBD8528673.1 BON domain-containing protein [Massilia sp. CFBP 13647]MBD8672277.1 BON domain-containing protein [Massilia sp. CFBP 13721]
MKSLLATLLATAVGATFATAPAAAQTHDAATQRSATQKAEADYKAATAKCDAKRDADKDSCMNNAKSVRTAALADAKAGRDGKSGSKSDGGLIASTDTKDPVKAAAVAKCEQAAGSANTGCLVDSKGNVTTMAGRAENATERAADNTRAAAATAVDKTKAVASTVAEKTKDVASTVVDKTKAVASTVAQKTGNAAENVGDKTREVAADARENTRDAASTAAVKTDNATDRVADKTRDAGRTTAVAASDTALTTKVKASLLAQPELKSLGIHVETEKGVVMLSGFVESKAEADQALKAAKAVDGVTTVKSAIKVK